MGTGVYGWSFAVEVGQDHGHWCVQVVFVLWRWARIMGTGVYRWSSCCGGGPVSRSLVCKCGLSAVEVGQYHGHWCVNVVFVLWRWARITGTGVYR